MTDKTTGKEHHEEEVRTGLGIGSNSHFGPGPLQ